MKLYITGYKNADSFISVLITAVLMKIHEKAKLDLRI